jgi:hypothetical protein
LKEQTRTAVGDGDLTAESAVRQLGETRDE